MLRCCLVCVSAVCMLAMVAVAGVAGEAAGVDTLIDAAVNRFPGTPFLNYLDLDRREPWEKPEMGRVEMDLRRDKKAFEDIFSGGLVPESLLQEPDDDVYYGSKPRAPVRLTNTNFEEFAEYIRKGEPVIVTDATKGWPLKGWSCDKFRAEFPKEKMRQEYLKGGGSGKNYMKLENENWKDKKRPIDNGPEGPDFAPWYWDFKANKDLSKQARKKMKKNTKLPYLMQDVDASVINELGIHTSAEFWLSRKEAGAKAHQDTHCESTMSVQLSGKKRWRLSPISPVFSVAAVKRHRDGDVDTATWKPKFDLVLNEGEGLFFPPGFIHETTNVGEGCAVSVTYQFDDPAPSHLFREFMPRMAVDSAVGGCHLHRGSLITFQSESKVPASLKKARARAAASFKRADKNKDGSLSLAEITKVYHRWGKRDVREYMNVQLKISTKQAATAKTQTAKSSFALLDADGDGAVTEKEYTDVYMKWATLALVQRRGHRAMKTFHKQKKKIKCSGKRGKRAVRVGLALHWYAQQEHNAQAVALLEKERNNMNKACQKLARLAQDVVEKTTFIKQTHQPTKRDGHSEL